MKIIEEITRS